MAASIQGFPHIRLFLHCWSKDNSNEGSRLPVSVPPTLIFEHGVPKAVLLPEEELSDFIASVGSNTTSSFEGEFAQAQARYLEDREHPADEIPEPHIITARKSPKDVSQPMLLAAMCNPVMAPTTSDPEAVVAYFVGISEGFGGEVRVDVRYMNREQLKRFFSKRELPDREGIQVELGAAAAANATKQSAILADYRVRDHIEEVMEREHDDAEAENHRHDAQLNLSERERLQQQSSFYEDDDDAEMDASNAFLAHRMRQAQLMQREQQNQQHFAGHDDSPPPSPNRNQQSNNNNTNAGARKSPPKARSPNRTHNESERMQLTGFLQRFEYTPSHHSEIVTMRWTRSYCDFERIRNSVLLEDRSRRAAERAATVDAPPTLVRRYSVTDRLKTLMRHQADLLADRFNAALQHAGRSFVLTQATFLFRMGFHGHVYFLWCSKMQLDKHHHAGPSHDWLTLVRRPPLPPMPSTEKNTKKEQQQQQQQPQQNQTDSKVQQTQSEDQQQQDQEQEQQTATTILRPGAEPQVRYLAFGRKFLDIGQAMLDREQMLRNRGLSRELGDLDEPLHTEVSDDSDDDELGRHHSSASRRRGANNSRRKQGRMNSFRTGSPPGTAAGTPITIASSGGGGAGATPITAVGSAAAAVRAGTGLMPLYSEHRIAVTQAQRHLGKALPLSTTLLANIIRRDSSKTEEVLEASRSLRANRDKMLEILRIADHSLHGRFERPKVKHAAKMGTTSDNNRSPSRRRSGSAGGSGVAGGSSSFIKEDRHAGTVKAKLIRLLGRQGRQAALMMPELIEQLEREQRGEKTAQQLAEEEQAMKLRLQEEKRRQLELEFEQQQHPGGGTATRDDDAFGAFETMSALTDEQDRASNNNHNEQQQLQRQHSDVNPLLSRSSSAAVGSFRNRPKAALVRSLMSSWKSWVQVYFRRMQQHFDSVVVVPDANRQQQQQNQSQQRRGQGTGWASPGASPKGNSLLLSSTNMNSASGSIDSSSQQQHAVDAEVSEPQQQQSTNSAAVLPIAASVPMELLELHFRQFRLQPGASNNGSNSNNTNSGSASSPNSPATRTGSNLSSASQQLRNSCIAFWTERLEKVGAKVCNTLDAVRVDSAIGQQHHIDDSALHNCQVIDPDDILCFVTPSVEIAEQVCRTIQRACLFLD